MNTSDPSLPNYVHPEAAKVRPDLDLMADLLAGTRRMWAQSQVAKYIRKWADEKPEVYDIRRQCETVFEGLGRVLSAAVGMLFAKDPTLVWNASEAAMKDHWANLDGMGTAGPVLCKRFSDHSIGDGLGLILVDHPPAPAGVVVTDANAEKLGLRPTWALYRRNQLLNWRVATVNNRPTLVLAVLEESGMEPDGLYGTKTATRYRVLRLGPLVDEKGELTGESGASWELWRETREAGAGGFVRESFGVFRGRQGPGEPGGRLFDHIPLRVAYAGRTDAPMWAALPLLGVAWANLAHWRIATALMFSREVAAYAQAVVIGELASEGVGRDGAALPGKIRLGPFTAIHLHGDGAAFDWKAPPVEAFAALERGIEEKLGQMGALGAAFLVAQKRAAETAEAKRLDATAENSTLATSAQGIEDAWNGALEDHAWYLGIEKAGAPTLTINKDFDSIALDPQTMTAYVGAVKDAGLPARILLEAWQKGGRIPEDVDLDALEAEMAANAAAVADQAAQAAKDALAMQQTRGQPKTLPPDRMAA